MRSFELQTPNILRKKARNQSVQMFCLTELDQGN